MQLYCVSNTKSKTFLGFLLFSMCKSACRHVTVTTYLLTLNHCRKFYVMLHCDCDNWPFDLEWLSEFSSSTNLCSQSVLLAIQVIAYRPNVVQVQYHVIYLSGVSINHIFELLSVVQVQFATCVALWWILSQRSMLRECVKVIYKIELCTTLRCKRRDIRLA